VLLRAKRQPPGLFSSLSIVKYQRKFSISAVVKTLFIGRSVIRLITVDSTNNYAASLPEADRMDGLVITAREQYAGRGQLSRTWYADAGKNLTATICLKPLFLSPDNIFVLNKAIALSLMHAVNSLLNRDLARIKWPNDIVVNQKKLAGILTENTVRGGQIVSYLAGFGLNVNQTSFPPEAGNPQSLKNLGDKEFEIEEVLASICEKLEPYYLKIRSGKFASIHEEYNEKLWLTQSLVRMQSSKEVLRVKISGVDAAGMLCVTSADSRNFVLAHGSVEFLQET
jgi:BirA family biotin operon repressor/biotin-[acetyl-CoA-carboxylase] ligase